MFGLLKKKEKKSDIQEWYGSDVDFMGVRDQIAPSMIEEDRDYVRFGNTFAKTLLIVDYPSKIKGNWLSKLYRFKGNINVSTHLKPVSADKMIKHLSKSIEELDVRLDSPINPQRRMDTENKKASAESMLENLMSGDNNTIFHVHTYIQIQAESKEDLDKLTNRITRLLFRLGMKPAVATDNMLKAFEAVLPINKNTLPEYTYRNMDGSAAASMIPFDESELFEQSGIIKGMNVTTDGLILVDPEKLTSYNEFIVGFTGMGKSFYMKKDMLRHFMQGKRNFIIDPEGEFSKLVRTIGGQVITISNMSGHIINPLEIKPIKEIINLEEEVEEVHLFHQKVQTLKVFFKMMKKDLSILEGAYIEKALIKTYEARGIGFDTEFEELDSADYPTLGDLFNVIDSPEFEKIEEFKEILRMYVEGSNAKMFNGITNVDLNNDLISFDLKNLEDEGDSQPVAMFNVLSFLWNEITENPGKFTRLYVDEAHKIADPDNPRAMKFLFQIYKRIRKYNGGATVATQQIADFLSAVEGHRNYGKAIIGNSISKLVLGLQPSDIKDLKENDVIRLSEEEERIISKQEQGEGIYVVGRKRLHIKVDYTPEELEIIAPAKYAELYKGVS